MNIKTWQVLGNQENFTILGFGEDGKMYFYKEGTWHEL